MRIRLIMVAVVLSAVPAHGTRLYYPASSMSPERVSLYSCIFDARTALAVEQERLGLPLLDPVAYVKVHAATRVDLWSRTSGSTPAGAHPQYDVRMHGLLSQHTLACQERIAAMVRQAV